MNGRFKDTRPRFDRPAGGRPRNQPINIQDGFLFESLKEGRRLAFALVTGKQIEGRIKRFDQYAVLVETESREILVYKSAIVGITQMDRRPDDGPPRQQY